MKPTFYEFFAGAGMARAGLGDGWQCLFANDIDLKKCATYDENWGRGVNRPGDINALTLAKLPGEPDLIWASFPCQDLSLAGSGAGLKGDRSGTFWPFWKLIYGLSDIGRGPPIVALENVAATLTSHGGRDFEAISLAMVDAGYRVGARVVDAADFVPQSRQRMFLIAVRKDIEVPATLLERSGSLTFVDRPVAAALARIRQRTSEYPELLRIMDNWLDWAVPDPVKPVENLESLLEQTCAVTDWHSEEETQLLLDRMNDLNKRKVESARRGGFRIYGTAYRRTRVQSGLKSVRTEVRFDGVAGCLRTPAGGSSRQIVIEVNGETVRSRLMTPREGARLMGLPDTYKLPTNYNEAYHLVGDGVAVGVVRHLAQHLFEPLLSSVQRRVQQAA